MSQLTSAALHIAVLLVGMAGDANMLGSSGMERNMTPRLYLLKPNWRLAVSSSAAALAALLLMFAAAMPAVAQVAPKSPVLCIDNDPDCQDDPSDSGTAIKWHPGHYMRLPENASQSNHFSQIDELASEAAFRGVSLRLFWYELETSKGVYDFSTIDAYLDKLKKVNASVRRTAGLPEFRLIVHVHERKFNASTPSGIVPNYLLTESAYNGGVAQTKNGYIARHWEQPVMDRFIALWQALGKRYDADPYLVAITTGETTMGFGSTGPPDSYSPAAMHAQWRRLISAARVAAPHTSIVLNTNMLGTDEQMKETLNHLVSQRAAAGGPDILPGETLQAQRIWTGAVGGVDYRGNLAILHSMDAAGLGGGQGDYLPQEVFDFAYKTLKVNYLIWARNTWVGTAAQQWTTGILPVIRANPALHSACPKSYQSCKQN